MAKIRILLVDDHVVLRSALRLLIDREPDALVVGEATDSIEAMACAVSLKPDVAVIDLSIPGTGGIKLIEQMRIKVPGTRMAVLTTHDDPIYLRAALAAGALAYVVKTAADSELLEAIRAVAAGRAFISLSLRNDNVDASGQLLTSEADSESSDDDALSPRETQVLKLLAMGHTNQAIAQQLSLSVKTVETYRARLGIKLGACNRADLVKSAMDRGLIRGDAV
jgi:two-component system, NarL family, response regulator NreC